MITMCTPVVATNAGKTQRLCVQAGEVYVPGWGDYGGINDRFALLHPDSAYLWKGRMAYSLEHCLKKPIHAEIFARDFAQDSDLQVQTAFCLRTQEGELHHVLAWQAWGCHRHRMVHACHLGLPQAPHGACMPLGAATGTAWCMHAT
jgi:hypothetical protein